MSDSNGASTLRGRTLLALREMLLKGSFPSRKRLEEIDLSRRLGVSRPVLRSVLERLSFEGLIETSPSGGYTARYFTLDDVRDTILARSALEGQAAGLAATRLTDPSELNAARKINAEMAAAVTSRGPDLPGPEELARFGDLNAAFHSAMVDLARSPMLSWCVERVQSAAFASPAAVVLAVEGDGVRRAFEEHEAILNAIQAGNATLADALVRQHAGLAIHAIEVALQGQPHSGRNIALELVCNKPANPKGRAPGRTPKKRSKVTGSTSERMLDAAAELFCERGFHAATTRELANRLHVQQASLYHHMSNKEELLHRICSNTMDCFLAEVPAALEKAGDARDRVSTFIEAHLGTMFQHPDRALAMVTEFKALSRPHSTQISQKYKEYSDLLDSELKSARVAGALRTDISPKHLRLVLLNILNWTPRWFRPAGVLSAPELSAIYQRVFWEGVANHANGDCASVPAPQKRVNRPSPRDRSRGTLETFIRGAAELFARHGYSSTSTRDLATLLGIEKATLYYHVVGKEDLLYAICKSSIEQLTADVAAAIEGIDNPLAQLQAWIQAHLVSLLQDQTQHATALAEVRALSAERLAEIAGMRKTYQRRIRSLIEAAQKSGQLRSDVGAKYLGLMLEGLLDRTVVWYRRSGELNPPQLAQIFCQVFVSGAESR